MKSLFADEIDWFVPGSSELPWTGRRTKGSQASEFFAVMWSTMWKEKAPPTSKTLL